MAAPRQRHVLRDYLLQRMEEVLSQVQPEPPPEPVPPALRLARDPLLPVSLATTNQLSEGLKQRIYRVLLPAQLLTAAEVDPLTWRKGDAVLVDLFAPAGKGVVQIKVRHESGARDPFIILQLADNGFNGIDCVLLVMSDPAGPRYDTDVGPDGQPTLFGTVHRHLAAEAAAKEAGLAPGQVRTGLRGSRLLVTSIEAFLLLLGHESLFLEPLTYAAAILFERRGFSYIRGRRLMETIHREFQPGGKLHRALDGSTPFRRPDQWTSVRGRAWAIHDGVLDVIGERWDGLRMSKRVGRHAGVSTFPGAIY